MVRRTGFISLISWVCLVGTLGCGGRPQASYDVPPVLRNRDEVASALRAVGAGLEAQVVLLVRVDREGLPREVRIEKSSGDEGLDDAALWVGERMRFDPARHEGRAVGAWVQVPVTFDVVTPGVRAPRIRRAREITTAMATEFSNLSGTARVRLRIGDAGDVLDVRDRDHSNPEVLDAARELVRRMEFWPALKQFRPIEKWVTVRFEFDGPRSAVEVEDGSS